MADATPGRFCLENRNAIVIGSTRQGFRRRRCARRASFGIGFPLYQSSLPSYAIARIDEFLWPFAARKDAVERHVEDVAQRYEP
ncbi:hypothetical protein LGM39_36780 [Burkholderia cepacia]|uniref:hypothetical protein n=1 Tax=Burkholderia cepacia TaxID=292 RepID=UPI001CF5B3D9|nr:hypothetical protein [Burkholderia cepacia]MCA7904929.1 hypothetical protein [Burkholderia cepacia]